MSRHDPQVRLHHMLDSAREAAAIAAGQTFETFAADRLRVLASIRLLEVLGEAATQIPQELREGNRQVPWREIIDLRNRLIHGYDAVNVEIVWHIVVHDLPPLIVEIESMLEKQP